MLGVILKPSVPDSKQVNLYQKGFTSVKILEAQVGAGRERPPQIGTLLWAKVLVPQTGKAVDGFCPGVVQVCAPRLPKMTAIKKAVKNIFMNSGSAFWSNEHANICNAAYGLYKTLIKDDAGLNPDAITAIIF